MVRGAGHLGFDGGKAVSRVGIDITSVGRIRSLAERRPDAMGRLFTGGELQDAGTTRQRWSRLASRFAAKEALIKAAGGLHGSRYIDVEVRRQPGGPPSVSVSGPLGQWLADRGLSVAMTVSHEDEFAVAMVWLNSQGDDGDGAGVDS